MTVLKNVERTETSEVTNLAVQLILKDLDTLVGWAEADARVHDAAGQYPEALDSAKRARTYRRCRIQLAGALK